MDKSKSKDDAMKSLRELLAAAGLVGTVMIVGVDYGALPQRVPVHFNVHGAVNGWGDKSTLWVLVGTACFLYATMSLARFLPESLWNLPVSGARREAAMPLVYEMVGWIKAEIAWMFAWLCWSVVAVATGRSSGLSAWFTPVTMIVIFGTVGFYLWRTMRVQA